MKVGLKYPVVCAIAAIGSWQVGVLAQSHQMQTMTSHHHSSGDDDRMNALVKIVRESTEPFRDVNAAEQAGYHLMFGCVSGGDFGAMGLHFVNGSLIGDDVLDPAHPEIVLYEPTADGRLRLTGADFLVLKDVWDAKHSDGPPQLMGQLLHLFDAPNRFGLPPFYTLHVWAWKDNPVGTFTNWNPKVSCDGFSGDPGGFFDQIP
ncbi:MAG TPA: hypothetical protein VH458_15745 [Vicinamibacterales bacterium]|jgi:hypothetical protein